VAHTALECGPLSHRSLTHCFSQSAAAPFQGPFGAGQRQGEKGEKISKEESERKKKVTEKEMTE
jgi:hypothetical protein